MHNGEINEFPKIKRALQASLSEELFLYPSGYTDSEWAFMVFLSMVRFVMLFMFLISTAERPTREVVYARRAARRDDEHHQVYQQALEGGRYCELP